MESLSQSPIAFVLTNIRGLNNERDIKMKDKTANSKTIIDIDHVNVQKFNISTSTSSFAQPTSLGVEDNHTEADGDKWDDDFDDVDDEDFDPANYPEDDTGDEEDLDEEEGGDIDENEDEKTGMICICIRSIERAENGIGGDHETIDNIEEENREEQGYDCGREAGIGDGKVVGEAAGRKMLRRSMSPSPEPPLAGH